MLDNELLKDPNNPLALEWVKEQNEKSLVLENHPNFKEVEKRFLTIAGDKDKLLLPTISGNNVYLHHTDKEHIKGILKTQSLEAYLNGSQEFEELFNLDDYCSLTKQNWVYMGFERFKDSDSIILCLSEGGSDSYVFKEYSLKTKSFIEGGFNIPLGKNRINYINEDSLYVSLALSDDDVTLSGYPRHVRILQRGQTLDEASIVYSCDKSHLSVSCNIVEDGGETYHLIVDSKDFYSRTHYLFNPNNAKLTQLPLPNNSDLNIIYNGHLIFSIDSDYNGYKAGSLCFIKIEDIHKDNPFVGCIFSPSDRVSLKGCFGTKNFIVLNINDNLETKLDVIGYEDGHFKKASMDIPSNVVCNSVLVCRDRKHNHILPLFVGYLTPLSVYHADLPSLKPAFIKASKAYIDTSDCTVTRCESLSKDGTRIPYTMLHRKDMLLKGDNPTWLYGYGGFQVSLDPTYSATRLDSWVKQGGVYVVANIRGGGEFGPTWWAAALKEKRQNAYDDFYSVAQHLVASNITSPRHLGIEGGSNGGLLMGVSLTQHPEAYGAVVCAVPLLDMERYHTLLAGNSWMAEYGNPDIEEERKFILAYSPLHNLNNDVQYPPTLFTSSTKDNRVTPYHARAMYNFMKEMGQDVLLFENTEGGHGGASQMIEQAHLFALKTCFMYQKLRFEPKRIEESICTDLQRNSQANTPS